MSLLMMNSSDKIKRMADKVFQKQFEIDPKLQLEYDDRRKKLMYEDILFNIEYLTTAVTFDEDNLYRDYAIWIYQLLCNLMKDIGKERIKEQMVQHYRLLIEMLPELFNPEEAIKAERHLQYAIEATENDEKHYVDADRFTKAAHESERQKYLDLLLTTNSKEVADYIDEKLNAGEAPHTIYMDIMQEAMYEVGNLWHRNQIGVEKEHACTAITQNVMAQFYPIIFSTPRKGLTMVSCCVGSELHELGARMLADIFELNGWDTVFLGAAVPQEALLNAIKEETPDLVALSVTMPIHLQLCHDMVTAIRAHYPGVKVAVGGRAFRVAGDLWKKWDVDISTENAVQLVEWANDKMGSSVGTKSETGG